MGVDYRQALFAAIFMKRYGAPTWVRRVPVISQEDLAATRVLFFVYERRRERRPDAGVTSPRKTMCGRVVRYHRTPTNITTTTK